MLIMTIISLKFMLFVIIMMLLYFLVPKKIRWCILLIGSYIYYFIASAKLTIFLVVTTFTIYWSGILMNKVDEKKQISCNGKDKEARAKGFSEGSFIGYFPDGRVMDSNNIPEEYYRRVGVSDNVLCS